VPVTLQARNHVHAHFPETDEADFHRDSFCKVLKKSANPEQFKVQAKDEPMRQQSDD
jgi:hypothetical protein